MSNPTSIAIPDSARIMFQEGMEHVFQQKMSRFKDKAITKSGCTGTSNAHRRIESAEMADVTGRLRPTNGQELSLNHRYVFPRKAELTTFLDEDDAKDLDLKVAPTGDVRVQHEGAASRKMDRIFLDGISGTNKEGQEDDIQNIVLPDEQKVVVAYDAGGNTGLTLTKLIRAKGIFGENEVFGQDLETGEAKLWMAVRQAQLDNLLRDVEQVSSADYAAVKALVDGKVNEFMGIGFVRSQQVSKTGTVAACPLWISNGVYFDFWYDVTTKIDTRPDLSHAIQVRSILKCGAARKEEKSVVLVYCDEAA